jgi:Protein of unknown function (DUF2752)
MASHRDLLAPLGVGAALAAGAAYVTAVSPSTSPGFIPCPFHAVTGLWCPGCGLTRGVHALFNGEVTAAIGHNVFTPVIVVAAVVGWFTWFQHSRQRRLPWTGRRPPPWLATVMAVVLLVYGVLRNIPAAPFRTLAP